MSIPQLFLTAAGSAVSPNSSRRMQHPEASAVTKENIRERLNMHVKKRIQGQDIYPTSPPTPTHLYPNHLDRGVAAAIKPTHPFLMSGKAVWFLIKWKFLSLFLLRGFVNEFREKIWKEDFKKSFRQKIVISVDFPTLWRIFVNWSTVWEWTAVDWESLALEEGLTNWKRSAWGNIGVLWKFSVWKMDLDINWNRENWRRELLQTAMGLTLIACYCGS